MFETIVILMMVVALLLILVILIQNPKGGGLSSEFGGGGATSQMFGVQKTGDILEQLTWGFFTVIVVGAIVSGIVMRTDMAAEGNPDLDVERSAAAPIAAPSALPPATAAPGPVESVPAE